MKNVLILTPSLDGKFDARFMDSLIRTIQEGYKIGINFLPYYETNQPFIQVVRNDLISIAYEHQIKDNIFIDADMVWNPEDIFKLIESPYDVVGASYLAVDKFEEDKTHVLGLDTAEKVDNIYYKTSNIGMGFLRLHINAINALCKDAEDFYDNRDGKYKKNIFDLKIKKSGIVGEDVLFFEKLRKNGFSAYVDTSINIGHIKIKVYKTNIRKAYESIN